MPSTWPHGGPLGKGGAGILPYLDEDSAMIASKLTILRFIWKKKKF